jgi:hypothetical protein
MVLTGNSSTNETADLTFFTSNSGDSGNTEKMRIDSAGKVGIGTNAPGYQLDLRRNDTGTTTSLGIRQLGSGDASMAFQTTTDPYGFCIGVDGSDSDAFKIATGTTDVGTNTKMTITTAGNATFAGAVTSTGIKFDANGEVLDDYEEGYTEFSSGYANGGGGTHNFNGNYDVIAWTRIGRIVHVQGMLIGSGYSGSDGSFRLGLPFVVKGHGGALTYRAANAFHIAGGGDGDFYTIATRTEDVSYANVVKSGVGADTIVNSSVIGSERVQFSLTYMTS